MRAALLVLVPLIALAAGPSPAGASVAAVVAAEVGQENPDALALASFAKRWRAAYEAGDFAAMAELYEPDAWLMTRNQPARKGREAILAYFEASRARGGAARIRFEDESLEIDGDYAFKTAHWWIAVPRPDGSTITDSGRSFVVFRRGADGAWRLWRDIDNNTPDVPPVTAETFE